MIESALINKLRSLPRKIATVERVITQDREKPKESGMTSFMSMPREAGWHGRRERSWQR